MPTASIAARHSDHATDASSRSARGRRVALIAASVVCPIAALAAIWLPVILHYHVSTPEISRELVARYQQAPGDAVLQRLDDARFAVTSPAFEDIQAAADEVLEGRYLTFSGELASVALEPTHELMRDDSTSGQLEISWLATVQVLLDAFRDTGEHGYFDAALRSALGWARFERGAWLPSGFLWNDHAIAARVVVLTDLWREYRGRADFDAARGAEIIAFVARSATLLARDSHYTMRTNHGIMQNLALLHVAAAFPDLPGTEGHVALAMNRLALHLPYFISPDGVVLEHSAGYQDFGIRLLRSALEYADILRVSPPPGLEQRYEAALCFRRHYSRPDGSVPSYGDTSRASPQPADSESDVSGSCRMRGHPWIDEDFGYASIHGFGGAADQIFMTWANFAGHAHKHDDELATWLWLDGRDWWSGTGYWPYGEPSRNDAISWRGGNAPHAVNEPSSLTRVSRLRGWRDSGPVHFLDVERRSEDGGVYRRQIAGLGMAGVLVLDSATGARDGSRFQTMWTLEPDIAVRASDSGMGVFKLSDAAGSKLLQATFFGSSDHSIERLYDSRKPFGGLVATGGALILPTETLIASSAFGGWSGSLWQGHPAKTMSRGLGGVPKWDDPEHWSMSVRHGERLIALRRDGDKLELQAGSEAHNVLPISQGVSSRPALQQATLRFNQVSARYPRFRDLMDYRIRATLGVAVLFLGQFAGLLLLGRLGAGLRVRIVLMVVGWIATIGWLYFRYLV